MNDDITLNVRVTVSYTTEDEARMVGQAVERLLGTGYGITITRRGSVHNLGLHPQVMNRDLIRRGGQEVDAEINSLVTALKKAANVNPEINLTENVKGLDGKTYIVDYTALLNNFTAAVENTMTVQEAKDLFKSVVSEVKWNQVNRTLR